MAGRHSPRGRHARTPSGLPRRILFPLQPSPLPAPRQTLLPTHATSGDRAPTCRESSLCVTTTIRGSYLSQAATQISQWLGHANLNTTMRYARADMDLKRQALAQVFPETLAAPAAGRVRLDGSEISSWLRHL